MAAASYDVVREILVRVKDVTTLFRCATVCKGWRSLLVADDGSFLRRCLPEASCGLPPLPGFLTQLRSPVQDPSPCFIPVPRSLLGPGRRFLGSFLPTQQTAGLFHHAVPLTSRHGLLLVRLDDPQHATGVDPDHRGVLLAVCDLLAGTVHRLPRLEQYWDFHDSYRVGGYALLTHADCSSSNGSDDDGLQQPSSFFKVLMVTIQKCPMNYTVHTFSSAAADKSGWNTRSGIVKDNNDKYISGKLRQHNAVVCGGAARWLLWGKYGVHTLDVTCDTGHVSSTRMTGLEFHDFHHHAYDHPYLTVDGGGMLMLLSLQKDGCRLKIWTSHRNMTYFQDSVLKLKHPYRHENGSNHDVVYTCLGEKRGMMLVKDNHRRVYVVDLKTGAMKEVTDWPGSNGLSRRKTVPMELDWPGLFAYQLASAT